MSKIESEALVWAGKKKTETLNKYVKFVSKFHAVIKIGAKIPGLLYSAALCRSKSQLEA